LRLYFGTSVLGALTDREDRRRITVTRRVFQSVDEGIHDAVISNVVQEELARAPAGLRRAILEEVREIEFELVAEDADSGRLFAEYSAARVVPPRYRNDLRHVAVATVGGVGALVSWNFRHLVNLETRRAVQAMNVRLGYPLLEIVSPEEI
jgi:predicted nucleic acid-binding protein